MYLRPRGEGPSDGNHPQGDAPVVIDTPSEKVNVGSDAGSGGSDDICYGTGPVKVCVATAPTNALGLPSTILTSTARRNARRSQAQGSGLPDLCVILAQSRSPQIASST